MRATPETRIFKSPRTLKANSLLTSIAFHEFVEICMDGSCMIVSDPSGNCSPAPNDDITLAHNMTTMIVPRIMRVLLSINTCKKAVLKQII